MVATFIAVSTSGALEDVEIVVRAEYGIVGEPLDAAFSKFLVDSRLNFLFELFQRFRRARRAMRQTQGSTSDGSVDLTIRSSSCTRDLPRP